MLTQNAANQKVGPRAETAPPTSFDPHQLVLGIDHAEALRILNDTTSLSYTADEVAAKMRAIINAGRS